MNAHDLRTLPLHDDDTLQMALETLLAPVVRRQLWMLFLDEDDVLMSPLMPSDVVEGDPRLPYPGAEEHFDDRPAAQAVADCFAAVMRECGIPQLVMVWERPGRGPIDPETREWARELAARLGAQGVRVRAQCLLGDRGLRLLRPDDLV